MPPANSKLAINVLVSIIKRFINNVEVENILRNKYDWNAPLLSFKGATNDRSGVNNSVRYDVVLNEEVPGGITLTIIKQGSIKYLGPIEAPVSKRTAAPEVINVPIASAGLLEDAIQEEEDEDVKIDLTPAKGWSAGEFYVDNRLCNITINLLVNQKTDNKNFISANFDPTN